MAPRLWTLIGTSHAPLTHHKAASEPDLNFSFLCPPPQCAITNMKGGQLCVIRAWSRRKPRYPVVNGLVVGWICQFCNSACTPAFSILSLPMQNTMSLELGLALRFTSQGCDGILPIVRKAFSESCGNIPVEGQ